MDKSTDKLCDHVCDKGVKKFEIFMDVIDGSPLSTVQQNTQALAPKEGYHKECMPGIGW